MIQQLSRKVAERLLDPCSLDRLSVAQLRRLIEADAAILENRPDGICQVDPRSQESIIYSTSRARRPQPDRPTEENPQPTRRGDDYCPICAGKTTGIIDLAPLSEGFTFINKNLFPMTFPERRRAREVVDPQSLTYSANDSLAQGIHLLQWTSSFHDRDWHNIPQADAEVAMERLAILEGGLLNRSVRSMPDNADWGDRLGTRGYVGIIKNYSRLGGGTLAHGHQQIVLTNTMPRRIRDVLLYERQHGAKYTSYMLRENPNSLMLRDYGAAVLLVPYFMRRPYNMQLILKDASKRYLFQLTETELSAVAAGWRDALRLMHLILPQLGREVGFNVLTYNGPGAGLHFEFLPFSQENGGYERLGLFVCQERPNVAAKNLRDLLAGKTLAKKAPAKSPRAQKRPPLRSVERRKRSS